MSDKHPAGFSGFWGKQLRAIERPADVIAELETFERLEAELAAAKVEIGRLKAGGQQKLAEIEQQSWAFRRQCEEQRARAEAAEAELARIKSPRPGLDREGLRKTAERIMGGVKLDSWYPHSDEELANRRRYAKEIDAELPEELDPFREVPQARLEWIERIIADALVSALAAPAATEAIVVWSEDPDGPCRLEMFGDAEDGRRFEGETGGEFCRISALAYHPRSGRIEEGKTDV